MQMESIQTISMEHCAEEVKVDDSRQRDGPGVRTSFNSNRIASQPQIVDDAYFREAYQHGQGVSGEYRFVSQHELVCDHKNTLEQAIESIVTKGNKHLRAKQSQPIATKGRSVEASKRRYMTRNTQMQVSGQKEAGLTTGILVNSSASIKSKLVPSLKKKKASNDASGRLVLRVKKERVGDSSGTNQLAQVLSSGTTKKSFNNLSIENPERELMEMYFGKKVPVELFKYRVVRERDKSVQDQNRQVLHQSLYSMENDLYSMNDNESMQVTMQQEPSPRTVKFQENLYATEKSQPSADAKKQVAARQYEKTVSPFRVTKGHGEVAQTSQSPLFKSGKSFGAPSVQSGQQLVSRFDGKHNAQSKHFDSIESTVSQACFENLTEIWADVGWRSGLRQDPPITGEGASAFIKKVSIPREQLKRNIQNLYAQKQASTNTRQQTTFFNSRDRERALFTDADLPGKASTNQNVSTLISQSRAQTTQAGTRLGSRFDTSVGLQKVRPEMNIAPEHSQSSVFTSTGPRDYSKLSEKALIRKVNKRNAKTKVDRIKLKFNYPQSKQIHLNRATFVSKGGQHVSVESQRSKRASIGGSTTSYDSRGFVRPRFGQMYSQKASTWQLPTREQLQDISQAELTKLITRYLKEDPDERDEQEVKLMRQHMKTLDGEHLKDYVSKYISRKGNEKAESRFINQKTKLKLAKRQLRQPLPRCRQGNKMKNSKITSFFPQKSKPGAIDLTQGGKDAGKQSKRKSHLTGRVPPETTKGTASQTSPSRGVIFPLLLECKVVAKFMCQRGLADRLIAFDQPHELSLEREPSNRHDPRAVKVVVAQKDSLTKAPTSAQGADLVKLQLGYVPKDLAFNLSSVMDFSHAFKLEGISYSGREQNLLTIKIGLRENVLRDQRQLKPGGLCYLRKLPKMPHELRKSLVSLQDKFNLNKLRECLDAQEVEVCLDGEPLTHASLTEANDQAEQPNKSKSDEGQQAQASTNKYVRNIHLVLETVIEGFSNLFTVKEKEIYRTIRNELSPESVTLLARMILRKRQWFAVDLHLTKYGDPDSLQASLKQMVDHQILLTIADLEDDLLEQVQSQVDQSRLEPMAELLESMTVAKLDRIGKLATKCIRKVSTENILAHTHEVAPYNPLFHYWRYLEALMPGEPADSFLGQLTAKVEKISLYFSGHMIEYMQSNERKFKSQLSKRKQVHKVLRRLHGLIMLHAQQSETKSAQSEEGDGQQSNLLSFFSFKPTQTQQVARLCDSSLHKSSEKATTEDRKSVRAQKALRQLFKEISNLYCKTVESSTQKIYLVRVHPVVKSLITRCTDLFFFYRIESPFEALQAHDFGFYQYEPFESYLGHSAKQYDALLANSAGQQKISLSQLMVDHPYLKPIFKARDQVLVYDALIALKSQVVRHFADLKIKSRIFIAVIGLKLAKFFLRHLSGDSRMQIDNIHHKHETRAFLQEAIAAVIVPQQEIDIQSPETQPQSACKKNDDCKSVQILEYYECKYQLALCLDKLAEHLLEKQKRYESAAVVYASLLNCKEVNATKRGKWWVRLVTDLKHLRLAKDALRICKVALSDQEWVKTGKLNHLLKTKKALESALLKKNKNSKSKELATWQNNCTELGDFQIDEQSLNSVHIFCTRAEAPPTIINPDTAATAQKARYFNPHTNEYFDVENLALRYYNQHEGLKGMHCENSFGKTLFGLLCWDIIFDSEVPYVFQTPFQKSPLDFGTKNFFLLRQKNIKSRLQQIQEMKKMDIEEEISKAFEVNKFKHNALVNWQSSKLTKKRITEVAQAIGPVAISKILLNYCKDYKYWNNGMPDLVLWNGYSTFAKFSEVKSENDRLSEVQIAWLDFFNQNGIEAEVCYINRPSQTSAPSIQVFSGDQQ